MSRDLLLDKAYEVCRQRDGVLRAYVSFLKAGRALAEHVKDPDNLDAPRALNAINAWKAALEEQTALLTSLGVV